MMFFRNLGANFSGRTKFVRGDTLTNLKSFIDSAKTAVKGYGLIYQNRGKIDSVWQLDHNYRLTDKAYNLGNEILQVFAYDHSMNPTDKFLFNYGQKIKDENSEHFNSLSLLLRDADVYTSYDRNRYSVSSLWLLSIGIDDYGSIRWKNSKSDAVSYANFFKQEYRKYKGSIHDSLFYSYVLLDKDATKESILKVLKEIALKASSNDYFIFNFSGQSNFFGPDSINYFFPYDVTGYIYKPKNRKTGDTTDVLKNLISQNILQEYLQMIPATNQLFISEAGPSAKFKTEFIKTLMQNSFSLAGVLNKNRVIIVPNEFGLDEFYCNKVPSGKAPINFAITSLDSKYNAFELFENNKRSERISFLMKSSLFDCNDLQVNENYFNIFFEQKFLREYRELLDGGEGQTRGMKLKPKEMQETITSLTGKHYALVVGTDNYKGKGWNKLSNPVKDDKAVADELSNSYGFGSTTAGR